MRGSVSGCGSALARDLFARWRLLATGGDAKRRCWWKTRRSEKEILEGYPSGQRGQTENLLAHAFGGSTNSPGANLNSPGWPRRGEGQEARSHPPPRRREAALLVENKKERERDSGGIPKRPTGADCKSAGSRLRWFESTSLHQIWKRGKFHGRWFRATENEMKVRKIRRERILTRRKSGAAPEGRRAGCPESSTSLHHEMPRVESRE
jgi:hypothetical protein